MSALKQIMTVADICGLQGFLTRTKRGWATDGQLKKMLGNSLAVTVLTRIQHVVLGTAGNVDSCEVRDPCVQACTHELQETAIRGTAFHRCTGNEGDPPPQQLQLLPLPPLPWSLSPPVRSPLPPMRPFLPHPHLPPSPSSSTRGRVGYRSMCAAPATPALALAAAVNHSSSLLCCLPLGFPPDLDIAVAFSSAPPDSASCAAAAAAAATAAGLHPRVSFTLLGGFCLISLFVDLLGPHLHMEDRAALKRNNLSMSRWISGRTGRNLEGATILVDLEGGTQQITLSVSKVPRMAAR